jgi:uncharacterized UBP type Zn finger protein
MIPAQNTALGAPAISPNGSAPRCKHPDGLPPVTPQSGNCQDCHPPADTKAALLICLTCGWVACSDDSPGQHARAHCQGTGHPPAARLGSGSPRILCYIHQRPV